MSKVWIACGMIMMWLFVGCSPQVYHDVPRKLGMPEAELLVDGRRITIVGQDHQFVFQCGTRQAWVDGVQYFLHRPAGTHSLSEQDVELLYHALKAPPVDASSNILTILLDAGHGATDTGCRKGSTYEKQITLAIVLEVKRLLEAKGHYVLLTRADDSTPHSLDERTAMAARQPIDAFVSVHVNSAGNSLAKGVEVYTLPAPGCDGTAIGSSARAPMVGQSYLVMATRLALAVQKALTAFPGAPADRGVRHAHFKVLRDTPAPAILVETGFITNPEDYTVLTSPIKQQQLARAIAKGILDAFAWSVSLKDSANNVSQLVSVTVGAMEI